MQIIYMFAAQLVRKKEVVKYIDSSMSEAREMREESGSIFLRVLQLWYFVWL